MATPASTSEMTKIEDKIKELRAIHAEIKVNRIGNEFLKHEMQPYVMANIFIPVSYLAKDSELYYKIIEGYSSLVTMISGE